MMLKQPESMDECLYFTRRTVGAGKVMAWVFRKECPRCHKEEMGKPVVKGKTKIRATEYICPGCSYTEQKLEHEQSLTMNVAYTCPKCSHIGEVAIPYKRTNWMGVPSYVFVCEKCNEKTGITKKMKEAKGKNAAPVDDDDDD